MSGIIRFTTKISRQQLIIIRLCNSAFRGYAMETSQDTGTGPVKYSTSKAAKWKAIETRAGPISDYEWPSYQPYVISGCLSVFLLYFCVFREENDIDAELNKSLFDRIDGLEEKMLLQRIQYNENHGLETEELIERLRIVQEESREK